MSNGMSTGLVDTTLLGTPVLTGNEGPVAVTGDAYWRLLLDEEGEYTVEVVERVGEGIWGMSREAVPASFNVGDLCGGRSL